MKKFFQTLVASLATVSLALCGVSCGGTTDSSTKVVDDLQKIKDAGELIVGMECMYMPYNWAQEDDSNGAVPISGSELYANGYDVQIAKLIAEGLGVDLVIKTGSFDSFIMSVDTNVIDAVIAGMSPTAVRKLTIDFTDAYYQSNLVVVYKNGSPLADATSLSDVDNSDYIIAAQIGTFHLTALEEQTDNCEVKPVADFGLMQEEVDAGIIDGYVAEKATALGYEPLGFGYVDLVNNENGFNASDEDTSVAVGLRKNSNLTAEINKILAEISNEQREQHMQNAIAWQVAALDDLG